MPSKTSKSCSVAKPRGKGSQDDSEIKPHAEVHADEQDAPQTNGKKQRGVYLFIYLLTSYKQNNLFRYMLNFCEIGDRVSTRGAPSFICEWCVVIVAQSLVHLSEKTGSVSLVKEGEGYCVSNCVCLKEVHSDERPALKPYNNLTFYLCFLIFHKEWWHLLFLKPWC